MIKECCMEIGEVLRLAEDGGEDMVALELKELVLS